MKIEHWKKIQRYTVMIGSGAMLLQTGSCIDLVLIPSLLNVGLSALIALFFGTPLI